VVVNSSDVFLILRAERLGFSITGVVRVHALYNLVYSLGSLPLGHLSDRLGLCPVPSAGLFGLLPGLMSAARSVR
jgi:MFS family permease